MKPTSPVRNAELETVRLGYDVWHGHNATSALQDLRSPWYEWVQQNLVATPGVRILEVACGRGALVGWLHEQGAQAYGCDISQTALTQARSNFGGRFLLGDIHSLSFPRGSFDFVVCCETLEHTLDPRGALREIRRVLRPGGKLLLTTPSYLNTYGLYRLYLRFRGRPFGTHGIQPIDRAFLSPFVARRIHRAGFRIHAMDGLVHYLRPARDRLLWIERRTWLRRLAIYFALHFAVIAEAK